MNTDTEHLPTLDNPEARLEAAPPAQPGNPGEGAERGSPDLLEEGVSPAPAAPAVRVVAREEESGEGEREGGGLAAAFDWIELFVISLAIVIAVMTFVVRHSPVVGASMEPTVHGQAISAGDGQATNGDVMLISGLLYTPRRGDVVVINSPHNLKEPIIKRIIGVGGDTVELYFDEWRTLVNGVEIDEPYLYTSYPDGTRETNPNLLDRAGGAMSSGMLDRDGDGYERVEVPEGCIFVMGDHRNNSKDSRTLGCIDERYILGRVLLRIYPFDRFGPLE